MLVCDGFMWLTLMTNKGYFQGRDHKAPPLSRDLWVVDGHLQMNEDQFPSGVWSMVGCPCLHEWPCAVQIRAFIEYSEL